MSDHDSGYDSEDSHEVTGTKEVAENLHEPAVETLTE